MIEKLSNIKFVRTNKPGQYEVTAHLTGTPPWEVWYFVADETSDGEISRALCDYAREHPEAVEDNIQTMILDGRKPLPTNARILEKEVIFEQDAIHRVMETRQRQLDLLMSSEIQARALFDDEFAAKVKQSTKEWFELESHPKYPFLDGGDYPEVWG